MSGIVTFYSFKGGVGRSMALANIAVLLASRGQRVLCVDWDLEAPGLERYFDYFDVTPTRGGLLPFLVEQDARLVAKEEVNPGRYREHLWTVGRALRDRSEHAHDDELNVARRQGLEQRRQTWRTHLAAPRSSAACGRSARVALAGSTRASRRPT